MAKTFKKDGVRFTAENVIKHYLKSSCNFGENFHVDSDEITKHFMENCEKITGFQPRVATLKFFLSKFKYVGVKARDGKWYRRGLELKDQAGVDFSCCPLCQRSY